MKFISMVGAFLVSFALITYGFGIISLQKNKLVSKLVLWFLTFGIILDISATICMIIGSKNTPFTIHGLLGYSAFLVMFIDLILIWNVYRKRGIGSLVSNTLHRYSAMAYSWWVIAYVAGVLLVILK